MHCVNERLKPSKMSHELKNSQDSHNSDQSNDLSRFADNLHILKAIQENGQEEWNDGK